MKKRVFIILGVVVLSACSFAWGQTLLSNRGQMRYFVRDLLGEPSVTYVGDTTINRMLNYAQQEAMIALGERSTVRIDTIVTTANVLRYTLLHTGDAPVDTIMSGRVAAVTVKDAAAAGGQEHALSYIPPELIGKPGTGTMLAYYSIAGRNLLLGKSPTGGDSVFVYMLRVPKDLENDTVKVSVAKEDLVSIVLLASSWCALRDMQTERATLLYKMYSDHVALKRQQPGQAVGGQ